VKRSFKRLTTRFSSTTVTGSWKDTGNVADMLEVNRLVRRIEQCQIGHHVGVTSSRQIPRAHRLVLGDHSWVQAPS
jgi:dTDP-glucose pyrophosphorylase